MNIQRRFPPSVAVCRCLSRLMMMKVMMMTMTVLWVLLLYGVSAVKKGPGCADTAAAPQPTLDMAPNSVDDMYDKCIVEMEKEAATYLTNEKDDPLFKGTWEKARKWYEDKDKPDYLSIKQRWALYVYTSGINDIYKHFNKVTREEGPKYKTKQFQFHALHFYLTTAVQNLNKQQNKCFDVYRGTKTYYNDKDVLNKEIRFGAFASSSKVECPNFGDKGCFKINTCMGADISEYSKFKYQQEVLIPPYEVFKVEKITKKSKPHDLWCDGVYELKSTRNHSKYNCALIPKITLVTFKRTGYKTGDA